MVQGGYNAVLHPSDSLDQHFHDTIEGGAYLNDQELAWTLIATAPERIREQEWLNLDSLLAVSNMIVASALQRKESRGAHFRSDYPEADNSQYLQNIYLQRQGEGMRLWLTPVQFTRLWPTAPVTPGLERTYLAHEGG